MVVVEQQTDAIHVVIDERLFVPRPAAHPPVWQEAEALARRRRQRVLKEYVFSAEHRFVDGLLN